MNSLTHTEARELLHLSLDVGLKPSDRRAVEAHLAECPACAAYANDLARLDAHLFESMQARWADPDLPSLEIDRGLRHMEVKVRQRQARARLLSVAQPAVWTAGVIALVAVLGGLFGAIRPQTGQQPEETPTADAEAAAAASETYLAQMEATSLIGLPTATVAATVDPVVCMIEVVGDDVPLHDGPGEEHQVTRVIETGMVGVVLYAANQGSNDVWLMVQFEEPLNNPPTYAGWLPVQDVLASGECSTVPEYLPGDQVAELLPTPTLAATGTPLPAIFEATPTPTFDPNAVCYVAPGDYGPPDVNLYSGPGTMYEIVGSLEIAEYARATGIFSQMNYSAWVRVEHEGVVGWVDATYYMFDGRGTMGCWPLPQVNVYPLPPTFTPTPTLEGDLATPTPQPYPGLSATSTLLPDIDYNDVLYLGGDVGYEDELTRTLPLAKGATQHQVSVRVNVPPGEQRHVNVTVICSRAESIRWAPYEEGAPYLVCGNWYGRVMTQGDNLLTLTISLAPGEAGPESYTLRGSVAP